MVVRNPTTPTPDTGPTNTPAPITAHGLSGPHPVTTHEEKEWFETRVRHYGDTLTNPSASDTFDLDSLVLSELVVLRLHRIISHEHEGGKRLTPADISARQSQLHRAQRYVNARKDDMGLSRKARASTQGTLNEYVENLMLRARQFGIHRNEQAAAAITALMELSGIIGAFDRSNAEEKAKLGFRTEADIIEFIRGKITDYEKLDQHFQNNPDGQKMWVGSL